MGAGNMATIFAEIFAEGVVSHWGRMILLLGAVVSCCAGCPEIGEGSVLFRHICLDWQGGAKNAVTSPVNTAGVGRLLLGPVVKLRSLVLWAPYKQKSLFFLIGQPSTPPNGLRS